MIKPIKLIRLSGDSVLIERRQLNDAFYTSVSRSSIVRLHKAVSNVMNQHYAPRITLFPGGFEIEY